QPDPTNQLGETTSNPATEEVLLYPNPTSEVITILFNPEQQYERVTITDVMGKQIFTQPLHPEQQLLTIPVANERFTTGVYQVTLEGEEKIVTRQIVIQR
ncbi:MAG: T9SS type A sorting domain-containing protein, partial [Saprospiraceae bacterium]